MDRDDAGDEATGGRKAAGGRKPVGERETDEGPEITDDREPNRGRGDSGGEENQEELQKEDTAEAGDVMDRVGFDPGASVLTRRQAEVLVLRSRGYTQSAIAETLGTSRPNVSNVESTATENVDRAEETLRVVRAIRSPVRVSIPPGIDIYDVREKVSEACNRADIKVQTSAPELMKLLLDEAQDVISGRTIEASLTVSVDEDGVVQVHRTNSDVE